MFICQADCEGEARWVADQIKARYGTPEVHINFIGPVIGQSHRPEHDRHLLCRERALSDELAGSKGGYRPGGTGRGAPSGSRRSVSRVL